MMKKRLDGVAALVWNRIGVVVKSVVCLTMEGAKEWREGLWLLGRRDEEEG